MTARSMHRAAASLLLGTACAAALAAPPAKMGDGALVGPNGKTLYTFDKDMAGSGKSVCNGPCATMWPPLAAGADAQPEGDWSVVTRDDASRQWAYKGKPLYYFQNDKAAGDKQGDGFRDVWHLAK